MCQLKFNYQNEQISDDLKAAFEEHIREKYTSMCEHINSTGGVRVSTAPNGKLRGIIVVSPEKLNGLSSIIEL